mmetsp:Transcript_27440/g.64347  ORF Transcript_27440/g.64347 Transcript_27440/m.64347 type:complete len:366 (+) Transcript_27440:99-1196(+)|eukprot:CAMPEP_0185805562 /NCGR_PEP_ID=MMETSP1322-20130828/3931_1 /TAXON_ID=265543 /ORGANISM="Minutocellus polymorphus, Strain RCC2270" /LENGTH=365 /DNA_ID=CAMNT_0028501605 /DNA_START=79 /DNA_END=1176 /DNA_ORIENTATION=+
MCAPEQQQTSKSSSDDGTVSNSKWVLKARPQGAFDPTLDVELKTEMISTSSLEGDEILVESSMLSGDAFIRTMMDEEAYHGALSLGDTIPAIGYGTVVAAGPKAGHKVGTVVSGMMGAQTFAKIQSGGAFRMITFPLMTPTASLGLMGLTTGLTAYTGVFYVTRRPRRGETVVVTGAAGAVGSVAAQLAKATGARVIGVAGGPRKFKYLVEELKLDGAIDYKSSEESLEDQIAAQCPEGIDFIYDNVGGNILDELLAKINSGGRVVICGAVSQYSGNLHKGKVEGPSNYLKLAERGAEMKGFNVMQYFIKIPLALCGMFYYHLRGKVQMTEHVEKGIGSFPHALAKMFSGGHIGKMLVQVGGGDE